MAYAAVMSLKHTIHCLQNSPQISIVFPSEEILESAKKDVSSLQQLLQKSQPDIRRGRISKRERAINSLCGEIGEAARKLEDALESCVLNRLSRSDDESLADDSEEVLEQEINSFKETVKKMEEQYECLESNKVLPDQEDDDDSSSRLTSEDILIGLVDQFTEIKDFLTNTEVSSRVPKRISLIGMAGTGKTALARKLFNDESIRSRFPLRAFVTVGPKSEIKEIMLTILSQMDDKIYEGRTIGEVGTALNQCLYGKHYLIVLDDVWYKHCWVRLRPYLEKGKSGSQVLLTSRLEDVAHFSTSSGDRYHQMRFLNIEESWDLLRRKAFGLHQSCPSELEKHGRKIAENCEGLPLIIIAVARLLSKAEKTSEYWQNAAKKRNSVFADAYDEVSEILLSSYNNLPPHLKACFLYMGAFPPNCEITFSKLINLWTAEGFLEPNSPDKLEEIAKNYLEGLVSNNLVLVHKQSSNISGVTSCSIQSIYWHLCNREAGKEKFLHTLNSCTDTCGTERQRRLCIHNNILFGSKNVHDSIGSVSTARSLLCTGSHHQYPLPLLCSNWKLLKVLDALTLRFYTFPIEVVELVQLRYLALTFSGKIPPSISKLWNLEYLIVHRHLNIMSSRSPSYLPIEIWNMQELRCLQVMGRDLPYPDGNALLRNLLTLSYVSAASCTKEILSKTPDLKKLGIQIDLVVPDVDDHPLHNCFDHLAHLRQLESLKCVVVNRNPESQVIAFPASFPSTLKKLSLSGLGYSWDDMGTIAQLKNLEVLKLQHDAFQGPVWVTYEYEFWRLKFLLIHDIDLESWETDDNCFPALERLIIRQCYNLKEIPEEIFEIGPLQLVELVDCTSAQAFLEDLKEKASDYIQRKIQTCVQCSWID